MEMKILETRWEHFYKVISSMFIFGMLWSYAIDDAAVHDVAVGDYPDELEANAIEGAAVHDVAVGDYPDELDANMQLKVLLFMMLLLVIIQMSLTPN
jgi:hypothetical protein